MTGPDPAQLAGIPADDQGPVFDAPWQAQAFALVVALHERGLFAWREWAAQLGQAIAAAEARGDAVTGTGYYERWVETLEAFLTAKRLTAADALAARTAELAREREHRHG